MNFERIYFDPGGKHQQYPRTSQIEIGLEFIIYVDINNIDINKLK